jgi:two-component system chemotaxis sensor kinase CheA
MAGPLDEAKIEFLDESNEMLERVSINLAQVEKGNYNSETLNEIYRDMHTIKGSAQLFGFAQIGSIAHALETALDPVREGLFAINSELVDATYRGIDIIRTTCAALRNADTEPEIGKNVSALVANISDITIRSIGADTMLLNDSPALISDNETSYVREDLTTAASKLEVERPFTMRTAPLTSVGQSPESLEAKEATHHSNLHNVAGNSEVTSEPEDAGNSAQAQSVDVASSKGENSKSDVSRGESNDSIRVQVSLLDNLMNMIGELVLIRNQVIQHSGSRRDSTMINLSQRLNTVTSELQNGVMKTRMQPIGNVLSKFHRVVRDMAKSLDKEIVLKLEGAETELDKTLIEAVKDPLTHVVRNSVDHGIETMEERKKAGKPGPGVVSIKSYHEGGQVIIEVSDNGRGLNPERIGKKAIEKGLVTAEKLSRMSVRDIQHLVFAPGFSTAEKVSSISGRGVGMDVVRSNIEKVGGSVELLSEPSVGTVTRLKIPLTLAIVPALIVTFEGARYAIPQVKLVELVRVDSSSSALRAEVVHGEPILRLRGKILPLVHMKRVMGGANSRSLRGVDLFDINADLNIVVLSSDMGQFGLIVDSIEDSVDIVVKPLSSILKGLSVFSGATVMGDGGLALTIDVNGIANSAGVSKPDEDVVADKLVTSTNLLADEVDYLLISLGSKEKFGIPLALVHRLEEFPSDHFETTGAQQVMRYRNMILQCFDLGETLGLKRDASPNVQKEKVQVIVFERGDKMVGFRVDQIQDVMAISSNVQQSPKQRMGIVGGMIHGTGIITVLDILEVIDHVLGNARGTSLNDASDELRKRRTGKHLLVAEDNGFFRKQVKKILEAAGYNVIVTNDGREAMERIEKARNDEFSLIVSDIEMPRMTGLELVQYVRTKSNKSKIPMIAVTTKFTKADLDRGLRAGFNKYLEKLRPDELIEAIDETLGLCEEVRRGA